MTNEQFSYWLAGLTDGEGHFGITIATHRARPFYRCVFRITLAVTDRALLEMAAARTGWGRLYQYPQRRARHHDYVVWTVSTKEVGVVADFFERYPLQSKKAADFRIWAPAARAQVLRRSIGPRRDESVAAIMESAYQDLRALRRAEGVAA